MKNIESSDTRKIAVIMFTDMVGYSKKMQQDENKALRLLHEHNELMEEQITLHRGNVIKTIGDAFFAEFDSALNAVNCAVTIQKKIVQVHAGKKVEDSFEVSIGIHMGEVLFQGSDILGDGVNIAARIESIAGGGQIYISQDVYSIIFGKLKFSFNSLGVQPLKNISRRLVVYDVLWDQTKTKDSVEPEHKDLDKGGYELLSRIKEISFTVHPLLDGNYCTVPFIPGYPLKVDISRYGIKCDAKIETVQKKTFLVDSSSLVSCLKKLDHPLIIANFTNPDRSDEFHYFEAVVDTLADDTVTELTTPNDIRSTQRRKFARIYRAIPVTIHKIDDREILMLREQIIAKDVSLGGLKLIRKLSSSGGQQAKGVMNINDKNKNSILLIELKLPGMANSFKVEGIVMWVCRTDKNFEYGIKFTKISQKDKVLLSQFLNREKS